MKDYSLDFLTTLLAAHAPSPSIWLGWSLGGLLAMDAALRFPEQVAALILIAATPRFTSADDWPYGIPLALFRGFERSVMEHPEDALHRFASLLAYGGIKASAIARSMHERMSRFGSSDKRALLGGLKLLATTDLRSEAARIRCPALILLGENDALVPAHAAVPIHASFSKARTEMVPEAAHAPFLSHPEQTLSLILEFMDEHCLT
jgi:pimeloyl-[acyl-carrier protein] methyl ester esterase